MPYFKYSPKRGIRFYWEAPSEERVCEVNDAATSASCVDDGNAASMSGDGGETSSSSYKTKYEKLPHSLKSCLDYCSLLIGIETFRGLRMEKVSVVRMMVAEGLIEDKAGETDASCLEDIASSFIDELVSLGMLIQSSYKLATETILDVPEPYFRLCVVDGEKKDFDARIVDSPIRVCCFYPYSVDAENFHLLENLPIRSLQLVFWGEKLPQAMIDIICRQRSLLVLDVEKINELSLNMVVGLVNLRYLRLENYRSRGMPQTLGDFPHLQTLESNSLDIVPEKVSHLKTLRHLRSVDGSCENIGELSSLTQLRSLRVDDVNHENGDELLKTITSMKNLTSLSMQTESFYYEGERIDFFPLLESFSPPPLLQELLLRGTLIEFPFWIADLKNLVSIVLIGSQLTEIPSNILQYLPALKHLHLQNAFKAKLIGGDFCSANGFPRLETLVIWSIYLIEWTGIAAGGFPCLKSLGFEYCPKLMFLPEGLQNISTLQELIIKPAHGDLVRRLNGDENYKIKHIPCVRLREW